MATQKWQSTAGPRQVPVVNKALNGLTSEAGMFIELRGIHDGRTAEEAAADPANADNVHTIWSFGIGGIGGEGRGAEVRAALERVRERFANTITRDNYRDVAAALDAERDTLAKSRPIKDERETAAEVAARDAWHIENNAKMAADQARREAATAAIMAKKPAGADALITAEYREDTSHLQSDYIASQTVATYAIGWRYGKREDFAQLRAAAVAFFAVPRTEEVQTCPGGSLEHPCRHRGGMYGDGAPRAEGEGPHPITVHVDGTEAASLTEHRDNYSMGAGNYLSTFGSARGGTGWLIRSTTSRRADDYRDALPPTPARVSVPRTMTETDRVLRSDATTTFHTAADLTETAATVTPSTQRAGYVEVRFASKPDEAVRGELKRAGFRWAFRSACWYGPATRIPERYEPAMTAALQQNVAERGAA